MNRQNALTGKHNKMHKRYFHLTHPDNAPSIQFEGIKSNSDGQIFLFENVAIENPKNGKTFFVSDHIADNQVGLEEYVMFEILPKGIKGEIVNDNVAETCAECQWILTQSIIFPSYLKHCGSFKPDSKSLREFLQII